MWLLSLAFGADVSVPVSGVVHDVGGAPLSGSQVLTFTLSADAAGAQVLDAATATVLLDAGAFSVMVPFDDVHLRTGADRYLSVTVGGVASAAAPVGFAPRSAWASDAGRLGGVDINGFLQTIGGLLTGPLSGTSATFSGTVTAGGFSGNGAAITDLAASELTGTIPGAALPADVVRTTGVQTVGGAKSFSDLAHLAGGARLQNAGAAPASCGSGNLGQMYFDVAIDAMRVCRATGWSTLRDEASGGGGGQLGVYASASRPSGAAVGTVIYNSTTQAVELWNGSAWVNVGGSTGAITATGGTVSTVGNYRVHTFTSSGSFQVTAADPAARVEVLVVAGGGGGGLWFAGGGGGGGVVYATNVPVSTGSIPVTVGAGGLGQTAQPGVSNVQGNFGFRGGDSAFGSGLVARGGGGGPGYNGTPGDALSYKFVDGGSGGGGRLNGFGPAGRPSRTYTSIATLGTAQIFGHRGGVQGGTFGGGGGGAGSQGGSGSIDGRGGDGIFFNLDGTATYYGAGGGGGTSTGTSTGGLGGGGAGSGTNGSNATGIGAGGGGGGNVSGGVTGGAGGAGVVIVRYPIKPLTVQTFTTVGTSSWTVPAGVTSVSVMVVGGGGGGAGSAGSGSGPRGGGGAGGYVWTPHVAVTPGASVSVTVGGGGAGGAAGSESNGTSGQGSAFGAISVSGGGAGGSHSASSLQGASGGSGGGASYVANTALFNAGTNFQGYRGGTSQHYGTDGASGGGGAGGAGYDQCQAREPNGGDKGDDTGGDGGEGRLSAITGLPAWYAGGGGAGGYPAGSASYGVGGSGVGGNGASAHGVATEGLPNTGSGGGAGGSGASGASGGSGIVIIAY